MSTQRTAVLGALALLVATLALAAPREGRGRERARTYLVVRLAETLDLSDEKALQISKLLRASEAKRNELTDRRTGIEGRLRELLNQKPLDPTALGALVEEATRLDEQTALLPEQTIGEVLRILTPEQQARLVLFRPELQRQIRRALHQRLKPGAPRRRARLRATEGSLAERETSR